MDIIMHGTRPMNTERQLSASSLEVHKSWASPEAGYDGLYDLADL